MSESATGAVEQAVGSGGTEATDPIGVDPKGVAEDE
jgi:hypothetical protein